MATAFEGTALMWRAIESTTLYTFTFRGLIIVDSLFSLLAFIGVYQTSKNRYRFNTRKES